MRFDYYRRLSAEHKAIYRRSDEIKHIPLSNAGSLASHVKELREALEAEREQQVRKSARALVDGITGMMGVERVHVIVRRQRPRNDWGELHGYYTMVEGRGGQIEVWMRTAANANVVAFRTFLRTLLHEVCHHLDLVWLRLDESFHTQGFFARESSLTRQLVGKGTPRPKPSAKSPTETAPKVRAAERVEEPAARQLSLF